MFDGHGPVIHVNFLGTLNLWSFGAIQVVCCCPMQVWLPCFSCKIPPNMPNFENSPKIEFLGYGGVLGVKLKLLKSSILSRL